MFYYQRDESNCLDHTNCIIKGGIFRYTVQGTFPMASSEKWVGKQFTLVPEHHPEGKSVGKKSILLEMNLLPLLDLLVNHCLHAF